MMTITRFSAEELNKAIQDAERRGYSVTERGVSTTGFYNIHIKYWAKLTKENE